ncbi:hypothetical protein BU17DRAFT_69387 [Hysterangium stoloniferum]|nr:hypothetical protein BU17DRAFT_69387 [Hysterangium stoloniferum]
MSAFLRSVYFVGIFILYSFSQPALQVLCEERDSTEPHPRNPFYHPIRVKAPKITQLYALPTPMQTPAVHRVLYTAQYISAALYIPSQSQQNGAYDSHFGPKRLRVVSWIADIEIVTPSSSSACHRLPLLHNAKFCRTALVVSGPPTVCVAGVLFSISKAVLWLVLSPNGVTRICACSQPIRNAFASESADPLVCHPYYVRNVFHHDVGEVCVVEESDEVDIGEGSAFDDDAAEETDGYPFPLKRKAAETADGADFRQGLGAGLPRKCGSSLTIGEGRRCPRVLRQITGYIVAGASKTPPRICVHDLSIVKEKEWHVQMVSGDVAWSLKHQREFRESRHSSRAHGFEEEPWKHQRRYNHWFVARLWDSGVLHRW